MINRILSRLTVVEIYCATTTRPVKSFISTTIMASHEMLPSDHIVNRADKVVLQSSKNELFRPRSLTIDVSKFLWGP